MSHSFLFISGGEIVVIMLVALLFFGSKSIPDIARTLGKGLREFKKATNEIQREFDANTSDIRKEFNEVESTVRREANKMTEDFRSVSNKLTEEANRMTEKQEVTKQQNVSPTSEPGETEKGDLPKS